MKDVVALVCVCSLIAVAAPVGATQSVVDRNVAFLLDGLGLDAAPDGTASVWSDRVYVEMPVADALRLAAARAGDVDLAAVAAASGVAPGISVGDLSIIEFGYAPCGPPPTGVFTPLPPTRLHPQLRTYGAVGSGHVEGVGLIVDWTTKGLTGGTFAGSADWVGTFSEFCVYFFGFRLYWLDVTGVITY